MTSQPQPLPATRDQLAALARQAVKSDTVTDDILSELTLRVIALEEVAAARWPRRWFLAARLGRLLRRSVRDIEDGPYLTGFRLRRTEPAAAMWDRDALWPGHLTGHSPRHRAA
jgi:hypothetical protein